MDPGRIDAYLSQQRALSDKLRNLPVGGTIIDSHGMVEIDGGGGSGPSEGVPHEQRSEGEGSQIDAHDIALFKGNVKQWIELDNTIRRLQLAIKQRRQAKKDIEAEVVGFMSKYRIEDLNTQEAVLRYSNKQVKVSLSGTAIKRRLQDYFGDDEDRAAEVLEYVFERDRDTRETQSLRRMK